MRTSVSLPDELASHVEENFASPDESDAQAIRDAVRHAMQLDERIAELETAIEEQRGGDSPGAGPPRRACRWLSGMSCWGW